jgi:hypothetical protein
LRKQESGVRLHIAMEYLTMESGLGSRDTRKNNLEVLGG